MIKSNPIPILGRQPTNWKIIRPQKFSKGGKVLCPKSGSLAWCPALGGGYPRASGFEGRQGLITGIPWGWGEQKLYS